ncbi:uncharacterized protein LOC100899549 [Galendromus occidentalis]|uniref:Uncharacterized protein LOC100899549 n=1 Tax=Galendromus occidentalis TaxID=34638 RepID=A0AAJ6QRJ2_9ACAR|nr:uncharacterized protein LOC100899549 [Galendromus occidentalis]
MPKVAKTARLKMELFVKELGPDCLTTDGTVLTCKLCAKVVNAEKKYSVQQHLKSASHQERAKKTKDTDQTLCLLKNYVELSSRESAFSMDLCEMMVQCNIPLHKAQHESFRRFLEKWSSEKKVPDPRTLRRNYLRKLYEATMERIRNTVGDNRIWVSVDETTDSRGQYVVNTVIGCLSAEEASKPMLMGCEIVERTNHATIAQAFTNALSLLWPTGIKHERVLLFISDAAPYMKKAGNGLSVLFPKMIHVTCLAHAVHRVCEEIRVSFPEVDSLIANVKKVFVKAPSRVQVFREVAPSVPLPPAPVLSRWCTWLSAALYYARNLNEITRVLAELDGSEAAAIRKSKELMVDPFVKSNLASIASNYCRLPESITRLECSSQRLSITLGIVDEIRQSLIGGVGQKAELIRSKLERVLEKNAGFETVSMIQRALEGEGLSDEISSLSASELSSFTFAPLVSVDVERSFSRYKALLSDRRYSLTAENVKHHIIGLCNVPVAE